MPLLIKWLGEADSTTGTLTYRKLKKKGIMIIFVKIRLFKVKFGQENFSKTGKKGENCPKILQ